MPLNASASEPQMKKRHVASPATASHPMELGQRRPDCPVCARSLSPWRTRRMPQGDFQIERCAGCGLAMVNPAPLSVELARFYATSGHGQEGPPNSAEDILARETAHPNSTLDARRMLSTIQSLRGEGRLLDVGCGYGFFSREAKELGFAVTALELGATERAVAAKIAGINALAVPFEEYAGAMHAFDVILMSQVLEHVLDVNVWIERARGLLVKGGVLAIALPIFDSVFRLVLGVRDPYIIPPAHLNFFTRDSLTQLLEKHGFEIVRAVDVTRLPRDLLSRRLPLPGVLKNGVERASSLALRAFGRLADLGGHGMMLNLYARAP